MKPKAHIYLFISFLLFAASLPRTAQAAPLDNWHVRYYSPGFGLNGVVYGDNTFVAVGDNGTILTSPDGTAWTQVTSGTNISLNAITYGNGIFVAVGYSGTILTSTDGASWTAKISGTTSPLNGVTYGNGLFVAVGIGGDILTSSDGLLWTPRQPGNPPSGFIAVAYGNGMFVALGYRSNLHVSTDGIHWNSQSVAAFNNDYFLGIGFGNGVFVVVGKVGTFDISPIPGNQVIYISTDGLNWTQTYEGGGWLHGVTSGNRYLVAVGFGGILSSCDGVDWTVRHSGQSEILHSVAYGRGTFVAVGSGNLILQSDSLPDYYSVPALSEWGMILLGLICGYLALRSLQKMRTNQVC